VGARPVWSTSVTGRPVRLTIPGWGTSYGTTCGPSSSARRDHKTRDPTSKIITTEEVAHMSAGRVRRPLGELEPSGLQRPSTTTPRGRR